MGTARYACGCCITNSMFGDRETLDVSPCSKHLVAMVEKCKEEADPSVHSLDMVADILRDILFAEEVEA